MKNALTTLATIAMLAFATANATAQKIVFAVNATPTITVKCKTHISKVQILSGVEYVDFTSPQQFAVGSTITLQASQLTDGDPTVEFIGWFVDGQCVGTEETYEHTVLYNATIEARYKQYIDLGLLSGLFWADEDEYHLDSDNGMYTFEYAQRLGAPSKENWQELIDNITAANAADNMSVTATSKENEKSIAFAQGGRYWTSTKETDTYTTFAYNGNISVETSQTNNDTKLPLRLAKQGYPTVATNTVDTYEYSTATLSGEFTDGLYSITEKWINVWEDGETPTSHLISDGNSIDISGLRPSTIYNFEAVAKYGDNQELKGGALSFKTKEETVEFALTTTEVHEDQISFTLSFTEYLDAGKGIKDWYVRRSTSGDFDDAVMCGTESGEMFYEEKDGIYTCTVCSLIVNNVKALRVEAVIDEAGNRFTSDPLEIVLPTDHNIDAHHYVDLGLPSGTLWANYNVGTTIPEGRGEKYVWSTVSEADESWNANWKKPSKRDLEELEYNCNMTKYTLNGVQGVLLTSKIEGYTDKRIFLPFEGNIESGENFTWYWGNNIIGTDYESYCVFETELHKASAIAPNNHYLIRPVLHSKPVVELVTANPPTLEEDKGYKIEFKITDESINSLGENIGVEYWNQKVYTADNPAIIIAESGDGIYTAYIELVGVGNHYVRAYAENGLGEKGYSTIIEIPIE